MSETKIKILGNVIFYGSIVLFFVVFASLGESIEEENKRLAIECKAYNETVMRVQK